MSELNRRDFIKGAGVAAAAAGASMIGPKSWANANEKIRVGVVGVFGRGKSHIDAFGGMAAKNVELVALCDVDDGYLQSAARAYEKSKGVKLKTFQDMRKMFEDKEIDAVSMATPNHWHALGTIWAVEAGKDVYVEKPASHNIFEGRQMVRAARNHKKIVQMGSQSRSSKALREAVDKMRQGEIGEVYMAKGLCYKWRSSIGKQPPTAPPPSLDYDLWCGPAEKKPFTRNFHPYKWHWFYNTGNGDIGNQGIHEMDKARWGLGVELPSRVMSMGSKFMFDDDQETANTQISTFFYPEQNKMLVFEVRHWITNNEYGDIPETDNVVGNIFYGSEGILIMPSYSSYQIFKGKKREAQPMVNGGGDHFGNFIDAVRSRNVADLNADILEGHLSTSLVHMANISHQLKRELNFDPKTEKFIGDEDANKMLTRDYRPGFEVKEQPEPTVG